MRSEIRFHQFAQVLAIHRLRYFLLFRPIARVVPGVLVEQTGILDGRINLRRANARVAQHFLNRSQIGAAAQ